MFWKKLEFRGTESSLQVTSAVRVHWQGHGWLRSSLVSLVCPRDGWGPGPRVPIPEGEMGPRPPECRLGPRGLGASSPRHCPAGDGCRLVCQGLGSLPERGNSVLATWSRRWVTTALALPEESWAAPFSGRASVSYSETGLRMRCGGAVGGPGTRTPSGSASSAQVCPGAGEKEAVSMGTAGRGRGPHPLWHQFAREPAAGPT